MTSQSINLRGVARRKWLRARALASMMRMQLALLAADHKRALASAQAAVAGEEQPRTEAARVH